MTVSGGGVEHWHRTLAELGVVPTFFSWEDGRQFARPRHVSCAWYDGETFIRVFSVIGEWNMRALVTNPQLAAHPTATWMTNQAGRRMAIVQFAGAGTWGLTEKYATAIFTSIPSELRIVQRRARQLIAGEGRSPAALRIETIRDLADALSFRVELRPSPFPAELVEWPSLTPTGRRPSPRRPARAFALPAT